MLAGRSLVMVDVANPFAPRPVASVALSVVPMAVDLNGDRLYMVVVDPARFPRHPQPFEMINVKTSSIAEKPVASRPLLWAAFALVLTFLLPNHYETCSYWVTLLGMGLLILVVIDMAQ